MKEGYNYYTDLRCCRAESCYFIFSLCMKASSYYKETGNEKKSREYHKTAEKAFLYLGKAGMLSVQIMKTMSLPHFHDSFASVNEYWKYLVECFNRGDQENHLMREEYLGSVKKREEYIIKKEQYNTAKTELNNAFHELKYIAEKYKESVAQLEAQQAEIKKLMTEYKDANEELKKYIPFIESFKDCFELSGNDVKIKMESEFYSNDKMIEFIRAVALYTNFNNKEKEIENKTNELNIQLIELDEKRGAFENKDEEINRIKKKVNKINDELSLIEKVKYWLIFGSMTVDVLLGSISNETDMSSVLEMIETYAYTDKDGTTFYIGEENKAFRDTAEYKEIAKQVYAYLARKGEATYDELLKIVGEENRLYFKMIDFVDLKVELYNDDYRYICRLKSDNGDKK